MSSGTSHPTHLGVVPTPASGASRFSAFCARVFAGHFAWKNSAIYVTEDWAGDDRRARRHSRELGGGAVAAAHGARVSDGIWGGAWAVDDAFAPGSSNKHALSFHSMMD